MSICGGEDNVLVGVVDSCTLLLGGQVGVGQI